MIDRAQMIYQMRFGRVDMHGGPQKGPLAHDDSVHDGAGSKLKPYQVSPTSKEWADFEIDEINRAAFGFTESDITELRPDELEIKWLDDLKNVQEQIEKSSKTRQEWARDVDLSEPIEVIYEDGAFKIDDGHHRYMAAKIRGESLPVTVQIKDQPFKSMVERALARGETVHPDMLKAAKARGLNDE